MPRLQRAAEGIGEERIVCLKDQSGKTWPVTRLVQVRHDKTLNQAVGSKNKKRGWIVKIFLSR